MGAPARSCRLPPVHQTPSPSAQALLQLTPQAREVYLRVHQPRCQVAMSDFEAFTILLRAACLATSRVPDVPVLPRYPYPAWRTDGEAVENAWSLHCYTAEGKQMLAGTRRESLQDGMPRWHPARALPQLLIEWH
ncbi:hypothetical protein C8R46DRAFT_1231088 [Mycena filopes]|nr:hypothetical protein C8R46DRAFT_1231088 [Mycena filopes]